MRHLWHLLNAAMLLQAVLFFTADSTAGKALHLVSAIGLGLAARMTRPPHPPTLPRHLFRLPRKGRRRG